MERNLAMVRVRKYGFTMIELLVVISIIGVISSFVVGGYKDSQEKYALSQATQRLVSSIRRAQSMAMGGTGIYRTYYGYGVRFDPSFSPSSYFIYASKDNDQKYSSGDTIIERVQLPKRIEISVVSTGGVPLEIFFQPPDPITFINRDATAGQSGTVDLQIEGKTLAQRISVSTSGLIQKE